MDVFNKRVVYSIELSILILAGLIAISYYNIKRSDIREQWVKHSGEVLVCTGRIQISAAQNELQARDFMLTGNRIFVKNFESTSNNTLKEVQTLKTMTADNVLIKPWLDSLTFYLLQNGRFLRHVVTTRKNRGVNEAVLLMRTGEGNIYKDKAAFYIQKTLQQEQNLMTTRKASSAKALLIMNASFIITICFIICLIIIIMLRFRKEAVERAGMLNELLENDERNRKAESLASFGTYNINLKNRVVNSSAEMNLIWGFDVGDKDCTIEKFIKKVHYEDLDQIRQKIDTLTLDEGVVNLLFRLVEHNRLRYISAGMTVIRDAERNLLSITGYVQDITEKTLTTISLKEANTELKVLFNRIGEVLFSRDVTANKFIEISDTCEQLFGYSAADFINDDNLWVTVMHPGDRHLIKPSNENLAQGKQTVNQYRIIRKDGELRWVENKIIPTMIDGKLMRIDAVIKNITEKKLAELEREKIVADVIQRNQTLEQFTYIVSHNLRAPVANIVGLAEIMNGHPPDAQSENQIIIKNIATSAGKLDTMIQDLNRILEVREQANENKETINLNALLADVKTSLKPFMRDKNIQIRCNFKQVSELYSIRLYLYSICYNLLLNSINFRREDIATIIDVETICAEEYMEFRFTDNGKGIDLEKNGEALFGLYRRFDTSIQGKGMGLFIVKTQVEGLNGTIAVESRLNNGAMFSIRFPVSDSLNGKEHCYAVG